MHSGNYKHAFFLYIPPHKYHQHSCYISCDLITVLDAVTTTLFQSTKNIKIRCFPASVTVQHRSHLMQMYSSVIPAIQL